MALLGAVAAAVALEWLARRALALLGAKGQPAAATGNISR
jgi:hypothetical protein